VILFFVVQEHRDLDVAVGAAARGRLLAVPGQSTDAVSVHHETDRVTPAQVRTN
jgi:hypothetical protein